MSRSKNSALGGAGLAPLAALALMAAMAGKARGALWDGSLWSLTGQAQASAGYDSNIFAVDDGPSDSFATVQPELDVLRKDSPYLLDFSAWSEFTSFQKDTASDSTDPGFRATLQFPSVPDAPVTQSAEVHWIRTTQVNLDVGGRVSQDDALAKYEGDVFDEAKTSVTLRGSFDRDEYLGAAYTTIDTGSLGATVSYSPQDLFRAGLGYDLTLGRSLANTSGLGAVDQTEQALTFQASGEFTPKLTGKLSFGAAYSDYTGTFVDNQWEAVAGADLEWKAAAGVAIDLSVQRGPYFNANGDLDMSTSATLTAHRDLLDGFSAWVSGTAGNTDHERIVTYRADAIEGAGAGLDYDLTGRLSAKLGYLWTKQLSDVAEYTYTRDVVTLQATYKF